MNRSSSLLLLVVILAVKTRVSAQVEPTTDAPSPAVTLTPSESTPDAPTQGAPDDAEDPALEASEKIQDETETEAEASEAAASFVVPEQMAVFEGHVGAWKGLTKTEITEKGEKTSTRTRSEWTGGYLLGGHAFEMRGYSYGELGRTRYRWQFTYDALKERYMAAYYDSHGRTHFCEGKINEENTKIIWRLLAPPGDMSWHAETDLQPENGIETNGQIKSEQFEYDMVYSSVFRRS